MTTRNRIRIVLTLAAVAMAILVLSAAAREIPDPMTSRNRLRASSLIFSFSSILKCNSRLSFAEPFTSLATHFLLKARTLPCLTTHNM